MHSIRPLLPHLLVTLAALPLVAQDMIGVTFQGAVLRMDSTTGAVTTLANGQIGKNCLAFTNDNRLWTTVRTGVTPNFHFHLALIDPFTGAETLPFGTAIDVGDLRAMAEQDLFGGLFAIRDLGLGSQDQLVHIDTTTGAVTVRGLTGFTGIQGFDRTIAGLRAWDIGAGVLTINTTSGLATDPFPGIGGPSSLQFVCTNTANSRKYVGNTSLYELDTVTGATTLVTNFVGAPDIRGAEFLKSRQEPFGTPCNGSSGLVFLGANAFGAGGTMDTTSGSHAPNVIGVLVVGFSETFYGTLPLPLAVDPLLGTSGCFLNVSADVTQVGVGLPSGSLQILTPIPAAAAFVQFYVQHVALDPVPGGLSFSKALRVRSGMF